MLIGRFLAGVRILVIPLAVERGMPYRRYVALDVLGASVWCGLWILLGFVLGDRWMAVLGDGRYTLLAVVGAGALIALAMAGVARFAGTSRARRRQDDH